MLPIPDCNVETSTNSCRIDQNSCIMAKKKRLWVGVSCVTPQASAWVSGVTSCFRCVSSINAEIPHPPTLTFNLHEYPPQPSIQTQPCSSTTHPFQDKSTGRWCLDGSRQVLCSAPSIPGRILGDRGDAQG